MISGGGVRQPPCVPLLLCLLAAAVVLELGSGSSAVGWREVVSVLTGGGGTEVERAVVLRVRVPRAILAALVGASLGAAGAAFQGILRNPLADPYVLGVSGGAALGAGVAIALLGPAAVLVPGAAFVGAIGALALVYGVARAHRGSVHALLLSGVMVGTLASALLLFLLWTQPADPARAALFWLAGDLSAAQPAWLAGTAAFAAAAFGTLWVRSGALDLLTQGEEVAADLGLDVGRERAWVFVSAGALTAAAVSLAGLVGFVGLVVPHAVRLVWGPGHKRLVPASALLGAAFLLGADALARTVLAPAELPVGVVTALLGAPAFLYLLRRAESSR